MRLTLYKKIAIPIFLLIAFLPFVQSQNNYQAECKEISNDGHVTIKIWNPKKGRWYRMKDAQKDGIQVLLFNGIASNKQCIGQKPLLQKEKEKSKFEKISKKFFKTKSLWLTYVQSSNLKNALPEKVGNKNWKVYQITVDRAMLKEYLEEQEIIEPLNTGF
jgi:hypothetical protein